jgi:protein-tyrosine phosphatase
MAEYFFKDLLHRVRQQDADQWLVESAGTWAENGHPAATGARLAMTTYGLDLSLHRSQMVTMELMDKFNLILVMEFGHLEALKIEFPQFAGKTFLLSEITGETYEIDDPIGGQESDFLATARQVRNLLDEGRETIFRLACK